MAASSRRGFLAQAAAAGVGWSLSPVGHSVAAAGNLAIAPFRFEVTPPTGHSCCGGWITPVTAVDDPLECRGLVLLGAGKPVVLAAVDWTGLLNSANTQWRQALAEAAGTTVDRVAVHCVHQHNAPMACLDTQTIIEAYPELPAVIDRDFFARCLDKGRQAVAAALTTAQPISRIAHGQAAVHQVASNRRVSRDAAGKVLAMRGSACRVPELRDLPEGLIDPNLRVVGFFAGERRVAACYYYATHPMSYYGDGRVSSDFVGLARARRQAEEPGCLHVYFSGAAGNVTAGKYNDGSPAMRATLTERIHAAMVAADQAAERTVIEQIVWKTAALRPEPRAEFDMAALAAQIANPQGKVVERNRPAYTLAWLRRLARQEAVTLSALHLGPIRLLHLPAESFVEYQLFAQESANAAFVATAAYGDGGTWYIPTAAEYPTGGYEVSVAFSAPTIDPLLRQGIRELVG